MSELKFDNRNANKGTVAGDSLLEKSIRNLGLGRSILVDKNNNIIAGNKTAQKVAELGLDDIIVIETNGTKLVVVKRTDININSKIGRELALADNQVGRVNLDFDFAVIENLADDFNIELSDWGLIIDAETVKKDEKQESKMKCCPNCGHEWE